jgi:hydrogenase expression/formation protein HypC
MCIALPCRVVEVNGDHAVVELGGTRRSTLLDLVEDVKPGDYLIVHAGYAINKVDAEEARKTLEMLGDMFGLEGDDEVP